MNLLISARTESDVTILTIRGRATMGGGESEFLSARLKGLLNNGVHKVVLNLNELTHVDSSGVGIIVGTCASLRRRGGDLKLLSPSDRVRNVLTVFRLLHVIQIFDDESEALASFHVAAP